MGKTRKTPLLFSFSGPTSPPPPIPLENKSRYERILLSPFSYLLPSVSASSSSAAVGWRRLPSTTDEDEGRTNVVRIRACDSEGKGRGKGASFLSPIAKSLFLPLSTTDVGNAVFLLLLRREEEGGKLLLLLLSLTNERRTTLLPFPPPFPSSIRGPFSSPQKRGEDAFLRCFHLIFAPSSSSSSSSFFLGQYSPAAALRSSRERRKATMMKIDGGDGSYSFFFLLQCLNASTHTLAV